MRPEELLSELAWMNRLARALVRDEDAAGDLVQEASAAALRVPPTLDGPAVARGGRTQPLEPAGPLERAPAAAGRSGPGVRGSRNAGGPGEPGRASAVAALILGLPEPLRVVLLLHYFENLSSSEIFESGRLLPHGGARRARLNACAAPKPSLEHR